MRSVAVLCVGTSFLQPNLDAPLRKCDYVPLEEVWRDASACLPLLFGWGEEEEPYQGCGARCKS